MLPGAQHRVPVSMVCPCAPVSLSPGSVPCSGAMLCVRLGCGVQLCEHCSGSWLRSTPQTAPAAPAWLTCAWQFLFPGSAGRAAQHPQQHKWSWLRGWKMLVINSQPGRIWEREHGLNPGPILNPTGGGMPGSLCSLGLSVNSPSQAGLSHTWILLIFSPG